MESSRCLAAIFLSIRENKDVAAVARDALPLLVVLANSPVLQVAEQATCALANLLLDSEVSQKAIPEEIIFPATRVVREGTVSGKTHAAAAIARLLYSRQIDYSLTDCVNRAGTVLALVAFLESAANGSSAMSESLDALAFLSRSEGASGHIKPSWAVLAEFPNSIIPIVSCITESSPLLQDKAIEILSRLCQSQPIVLGNAIASTSGCISSIAGRVIRVSNRRVKIGGTALLICAAKVNHQRVLEDLNQSNSRSLLIQSLVGMLNSMESPHSGEKADNESISICGIAEEGRNGEAETSTAVISGANMAVWLLSVLACHDDRSKVEIMEAGAVEVLTERISESQYSQVQILFFRFCSTHRV